jgi:hypothetical protein
MYRHRPWLDETDDPEAEDRRTASLAGVAVTLLLLTVGLFLVQELRVKSAIEDCLLSGRRNCDSIVVAKPMPWSGIESWLH